MRAPVNISRSRAAGLRIGLTDNDLHELYRIHGTASVKDLAKRTGLTYLQVYNLVHRRVQSVDRYHYRRLFGKAARQQVPLKVDGAFFRALVNLWLYLNEGQTCADLYAEFYPHARRSKTDHRIFNGKIRKVDARLEHAMLAKFSRQGVEGSLLDAWLAEFEAHPPAARVPYARIRPVLAYLETTLGLHPSALLNQTIVRYESGELKHVHRRVMERAAALKARAEKALSGRHRKDPDQVREILWGGKPGYTRYDAVKAELHFLKHYAGKRIREYLGRSRWAYEKGNARRIASWRARKILADCDRFILENPDLPLACLPPARREALTKRLSAVLKARAARLLSADKRLSLERRILQPRHGQAGDLSRSQKLTPFDRAPAVLGMSPRAFDRMVAAHPEIFRSVGRFDQRWCLPDAYLKRLSGHKVFEMVAAKYEAVAVQTVPE